jgi:hypothetical protein
MAKIVAKGELPEGRLTGMYYCAFDIRVKVGDSHSTRWSNGNPFTPG